MRFLNRWAVRMIRFYQKNKSIIGNNHCKHQPSCSEYGIQAYEKFNFFYASWLTFWRIVRCNPFTKKVYDPVPLTRAEKAAKKTTL